MQYHVFTCAHKADSRTVNRQTSTTRHHASLGCDAADPEDLSIASGES
jgi:hypothetical protein